MEALRSDLKEEGTLDKLRRLVAGRLDIMAISKDELT